MYEAIEIIMQYKDYIIEKVTYKDGGIRYRWKGSSDVYGTFEAAMIDAIAVKNGNTIDSHATPYVCKMLNVQCYGENEEE